MTRNTGLKTHLRWENPGRNRIWCNLSLNFYSYRFFELMPWVFPCTHDATELMSHNKFFRIGWNFHLKWKRIASIKRCIFFINPFCTFSSYLPFGVTKGQEISELFFASILPKIKQILLRMCHIKKHIIKLIRGYLI